MSTPAPPDDANPPALLDRLRRAIETLEVVVADRTLLAALPAEEWQRLRRAAASLYTPDIRERRQMVKAVVRQRKAERTKRDEKVLEQAGIRSLRRQPVFTTPNYYLSEVSAARAAAADDRADDANHGEARTTTDAQHCYICKQHYSTIHHFYDRLCPECAELNFAKRTELADLRGRVALLTGGRVKIGYQAGIKLLRAGARLIVTTRFPNDAATRYAGEPDFGDWSDRLEVIGLDLRHTPSVEGFCRHLLDTRDRLDFIVNNACQTVRRPPVFYAHMMQGETEAATALPDRARPLLATYEAIRGEHASASRAIQAATGADARALTGLLEAARLSQVALLEGEDASPRDLFPVGVLDQDLQQIDLRAHNSWRMLMADVPSVELLEVHLVNAIAPFIINARLKPLMTRTASRDKHIVNVSAVEGQFYRPWKTTRHPHTNMAKAALNMMTRTSAQDYATDGIHMNSVDTGWVTDEDAAEIAARKAAEQRFVPPLDIVDGAARIVDPIITGIKTGTHVWGQFLKDYKPTEW